MKGPLSLIYRNDLKNGLKRKTIIFAILLLIIPFIVLQVGINGYKSYKKDVEFFLEHKNIIPQLFPNYTQYGTYGIQLLMLAPPQTTLFPIAYLNIAYLDTGSKLSVYADLKQNGAISNLLGFAGIITLMITFISIIKGAGVFRNQNGFEFYVSVSGKSAFWSVLFSRFTHILIFLIGILLLSELWLIANGVIVDFNLILFFAGILTLGCIFYFTIGNIFGKYFPKSHTVVAVIFLSISILVIPGLIDYFTQPHNKSFLTALKNIKLLKAFQNRFEKERGRFKNDEPVNQHSRNLVESGQLIEYTEMRVGELKLTEKYKSNIKKKHFIAALFPPAFLIFTNKEIGGYGHRGLHGFMKFSQDTKKKFIRHYIQKQIYEKTEPWLIVPYQGDHTFSSGFTIPYYTALGIAISLFCSIFFILWTSINFNQSMMKISKGEEEKYKDLNIFLKVSVLNYFLTKSDELKQFIFKSFIEKSEIITTENERYTFVYLPDPEMLPKKAEKLLNCRFENHKKYEKMIVFLQAACKKYDIIFTEWQLDALNDNQIAEIKKIIKGKVYLNIGFDVHTFINRTKHRLVWAADPDVQALNPLN